jgi:uncharacterized protein (TIGR02246 family)
MADKRVVEDEVAGLERKYWKALKDGDYEGALRLTADPCIVTGAQGVAELDHATYRKMMGQQKQWTLEDFELDDLKVRLLNDDVAIVAYKVREDMTVDGKPLKLEAADTSTWIRQDGRWVCALHTEALTGDPFGRDKRA